MTSSLLGDTPEVLAPLAALSPWGIRDMETLIIPGDRCLEPGVPGVRDITMVGTRSVRRRCAVRPPEGERAAPGSSPGVGVITGAQATC